MPEVISIERCDKRTTRLADGEVAGRSDAPIRLTQKTHAGVVRCDGLHGRSRIISRAIVYDNDFQILVGLGLRGRESVRDERCGIVSGNNDGDEFHQPSSSWSFDPEMRTWCNQPVSW
jgi:hypothetical protein